MNDDMPLVIEIEDPDPVQIDIMEIRLQPDGSAELTEPDGFEPDEPELEFAANLAEAMADTDLMNLGNTLMDYYESDLNSRADWESTYRDGLDLLGLTIENRTEPWEGACGVTHPLLTEAIIRFQAETIMETFPATGPVKTKLVGRTDTEREAAARRVQEDMNHWLVDRMPEYRSEHERLLWGLAASGTAFKKVYYYEPEERPMAPYVAAEDFIISYGATDLESAPRYAHRMRKTRNELRKLQLSGFYRSVDLGDPAPMQDELSEAKDAKLGLDASYDGRYTVLEYHVDLDLPGYEDEQDGQPTGLELPYVVHYLVDSGEVLAIYRNWREEDPLRRKRMHFVKYGYIPGFGFYDFGLVHLVGGYAKSATSLIRQLVDAGTLSNLPGGLKSQGLRIKGDDSPIAPGEFRDVQVPSGNIKENILPLPYKEPSAVLAQLLSAIIEEGRRFAAIADVNVADLQPNAPVGSTLAALERTLKPMSAIQARVHDAMRKEFRLIRDIVRDYTSPEYSYDPEHGGTYIKQSDYDMVEIVPVSDPSASTLSQRIAQYQAALQLATMAPQLYDLSVLHRQMLEVLGIRNVEKILPLDEDIQPMDPVTENMEIIRGNPVKAFAYQDHESHIAVHMKFGEDPKAQKLLSNHPNAPMLTAALAAHIAEHLAFLYRQQIEFSLGVPLPPMGERMPEDVEVEISRLTAAAADKVLQRNKLEMSQEQAAEQAQDPIVQMQMQEVQIKQAEVQRKMQKDQMDFAIEQERLKIEQVKASMPPTPVQAPNAPPAVPQPDPAKMAEMQIKQIETQLKEAEIQRKAQKDQLDHQVDIQRLRLEREKVLIAAQTKGQKRQ